MADRTLQSQVAYIPSPLVCRAYGVTGKCQILFPCPSDREKNKATNNFAVKAQGLAEERLGSRGRALVCRIPRTESEVSTVVLDMDTDTYVPTGLETTRAALQGSFTTHAAVGRVECNSRGCRPIIDDVLVPAWSLPENWLSQADASEVLESRTAVYHTRNQRRDLEVRPEPHFPKDFAVFLNEVWLENGAAEKYFELAIQADPHDSKLLSEYATFSWKSLKNLDKAEELFKQALEQTPDDHDILANYAVFLWQSDS